MSLASNLCRCPCVLRFVQCTATYALRSRHSSTELLMHSRFCSDQKSFELRVEDEASAQSIVKYLHPDERDRLRNAILNHPEVKNLSESEVIPTELLKQLFLVNAIPLIGFGFLDNALMIVAGEYLDQKLGAVLAISTMAAAGLGHIFADLAGMGLTHYIEFLATKTGVKQPFLTSAQRNSPCARKAVNFGRATGLVVGCIIGMLPLLFYENPKSKQHPK